jgi:hypothetical protein
MMTTNGDRYLAAMQKNMVQKTLEMDAESWDYIEECADNHFNGDVVGLIKRSIKYYVPRQII